MPTPSEPGTNLRRVIATVPRARRSLRLGLLVVASLAVPPLSGCSSASVSTPVDPARAREALRIALEGWKKGDSIDSLKTGSPPIVAQDFDWMAGHRLVGYEVTGEGKDDNANLRIPVKLTVRTTHGREVKMSVSYVVGTSPSLTVFREFN